MVECLRCLQYLLRLITLICNIEVKKLDCFLFYVIAAAASEPEVNEAKDLIGKKLQYRGQPLFVQNARNCGRR